MGSVMWKYLIMDFQDWQPQQQVCSPVVYRDKDFLFCLHVHTCTGATHSPQSCSTPGPLPPSLSVISRTLQATCVPTSFTSSQAESSQMLFNVLCPEIDFLTDNVRNNKAFMTCVKSSEQSLLYFLNIRDKYLAKQIRDRPSNLKTCLNKIQKSINAIISLFEEASKLNINLSVEVDRLARMCLQKQEPLTRIGQFLIALKNKITSGDVLDIRCKVQQQYEAHTEDSNVIGCHMPNYT